MISPVELGRLEESIRGEMVLVQKFALAAEQSNDPSFRQICNEIRHTHQDHLNTLLQQLNTLGGAQ